MADPETVERIVAAYELEAYPYDRDRDLNPLQDENDLALVSWVDGWQQARDAEGFLAERAKLGEPALVVIAGGSGTGRTSLANFVVHMWASQRAVDARKLVLAPWAAQNYDGEEQLWRWALSLEQRALKGGVQLADSTTTAFADLRKSKPDAMGAALQHLLGQVATDVAGAGALAGIVEKVGHPSFLSLAGECLQLVDVLLVMTVDHTPATEEEVLSKADGLIDPQMGRTLRLTELSGEDAKEVIQRRWEQCATAKNSSPFPDHGLVAAFEHPRRTLLRVLRLVEALLVNKEMELGKTDKWPEVRTFSAQELGQKIPYLDRELR